MFYIILSSLNWRFTLHIIAHDLYNLDVFRVPQWPHRYQSSKQGVVGSTPTGVVPAAFVTF
jgi:hypothetical protein